MNKSAIQKFATWARTELIAQVSQRAYQYGITEEGYGDPDAVTVSGRALTSEEASQRKELVAQLRQKGYTQVMEEVAYTWFNRFIALRFMEVNNYLPSHIRVFSDSTGAFKPEILSEALHLDLPGLDKDKVAAYIENNQTEELYRYLLLTQCNALNEALSRMFEQMGGYTELLFPNNILKVDSVLGRMVADIPEEDWTDQVQIIGWLYQYYNAELKDETFALLKKNVKITKERIPSATQLFTPDWIVRYMVENSLGRLWIEGHPDDELKSGWKYYLDEAQQEPEVQAQLDKIRSEYAALKPQDIKVIDPCMGSGHILVYAFDLLIQIYKKYGVSERDAAQSILQYNLYGLDIDDRAAQLAYFAVMMKARQYDRRIFSRGIQPHVYALQNSGPMPAEGWGYLGEEGKIARRLLDSFADAKEYGSLVKPEVTLEELDQLQARLEKMDEMSSYGSLSVMSLTQSVLDALCPLIELARVLVQKYDVVVTNPPYMGSSNMDGKLSEFVKKRYPDSKSDLFACFIEKGNNMVGKARYNCMVTMQSWMFLSSFEKMRTQTLQNHDIVTLMHMENMVLGIAFGTAVTVFRNQYTHGYKGTYNQIKLCNIEDDKPIEFPVVGNRFAQISTDNFSKIQGAPVAYWWKKFDIFDLPIVKKFYESAGRNKTHNNELYTRSWWEIADTDRWQSYANGGVFRRWAGNDYDVVDWSDAAKAFYASHGGLYNQTYCGKRGVCWNLITSYKNGFRLKHEAHHYSSGAPTVIALSTNYDYWLLAYLNSVVATTFLSIYNPTLNTTVGDVLGLPVAFDRKDEIEITSQQNVVLSQSDWNSYEMSRDFKKHPMV